MLVYGLLDDKQMFNCLMLLFQYQIKYYFVLRSQGNMIFYSLNNICWNYNEILVLVQLNSF